MTIKIAINGFGRIGRSVLRALYETGVTRRLPLLLLMSWRIPKVLHTYFNMTQATDAFLNRYN